MKENSYDLEGTLCAPLLLTSRLANSSSHATIKLGSQRHKANTHNDEPLYNMLMRIDLSTNAHESTALTMN